MSPSEETTNLIVGIAQHNPQVLEGMLKARIENLDASGLDPKTYSLVSVAALIALDGPPASYVWQVSLALEAGVSPEEILGLLVALNPIVGNARVVAAAPELALGLGIDLEGLDA
ncbi:MAG: carboxymuconolactone decarboxylase family protein [Acidimicrobiales bacterium]